MKVLPNDIFFAEVEAIIAEGQSVVITVKGNSMRPFIRDGRTRVRLVPVADREALTAGDIVLFRCQGRHIMHRIIAKQGERLTLAGDGNYRLREECRTEDVVAKVEAVIRPNGRVIACDSRLWRTASRCWTGLHPFIRRCILYALRKMGIK